MLWLLLPQMHQNTIGSRDHQQLLPTVLFEEEEKEKEMELAIGNWQLGNWEQNQRVSASCNDHFSF